MWSRKSYISLIASAGLAVAVTITAAWAQVAPCPEDATVTTLMLDTWRALLKSVEGNPLALVALCFALLTAYFWRKDHAASREDLKEAFRHIEALGASIGTVAAGVEVLKDRK